MADELYSYRVRYRAVVPGRVRELVVGARDADDARLEASHLDPQYGHTVESPRRGRQIEGCHYCERVGPILDGTYTRVNFKDGPAPVCDDCRERGTEYVVWQGVEVELVD